MIDKSRSLLRAPSPAMVVALLALFLAIGSAAVAGPPFITKGDPAGGDLTGQYPDPLIAQGAVNSAKLADGAVGPSKLGTIPAVSVICDDFPGCNPIESGSREAVEFHDELFDNAGMFDTAANTDLTAPIDGLYRAEGQVSFGPGNPTGVREVGIHHPFFGCCAGRQRVGAASDDRMVLSTSALVRLDAGDSLTLLASQTSGSLIFVDEARFSMSWVGP